ncbi:hypothetical protein K439DRAFT_187610 [Ramaria rubella]|nr:hypothetical protein K439DRAFT_187610 [Ramaria rubella]
MAKMGHQPVIFTSKEGTKFDKAHAHPTHSATPTIIMCVGQSNSMTHPDSDNKIQKHGIFPFTRLPVEIATEIITVVISADQKADLSSLGRVCKTIHHWVTPALYKCVFLSNKEPIALFAATMQTAPRLRLLVENLWMFLTEKSIGKNDEGVEIDSDSGSSWESASSSSSDDTSDDLEAEVDPSDDLTYLKSRTHTVMPSAYQVVRSYQFVGSAADLSRTTKHSMSLCSKTLLPAVTDESYTHAHGLVILNLLCTSLQRLYVLTSKGSFTRSMVATPFHILSELTVYMLPDWPHSPGVKRLTILSNISTNSLDYDELSEIFPNLTHLRTPLWMHKEVLLALASLKSLTHLWLLPNSPWMQRSHTLPLSLYLAGLPKSIAHVKLEIPIACPPPGFADVNWTLYPLVHMHPQVGESDEQHWRHSDLYAPQTENGIEIDGLPHRNVFLDCIRHDWALQSVGGGWND